MEIFESVSTDSTKVHDAGHRPELSKKRSNNSARQKNRSLQQAVTQKDDMADDPTTLYSSDSSRASQFMRLATSEPWDFGINSFSALQQSYTETYDIRSPSCQSKLDDINRYGVSTYQEARLWTLETERLAKCLESRFTRNPFASTFAEESFPDQAGFSILSMVAREVIRNLALCDFDNTLVLFERHHELFEDDKLSVARNAILLGEGKDESMPETEIYASAAQRRRFYCALVDYATAVAARCINYRIADYSWHACCITSLARLAAKLKFLAIDSEGFARQSLDKGHKIISSKPIICANEFDKGHIAQVFSASLWALESLQSIFNGLKLENKTASQTNNFSMGIIVYDTGWEHIPIVLSHDQYGEISGSRVRSAAWTIKGAFETLTQMVDVCKLNSKKQSLPPTSTLSASMMVEYEDTEREYREHTLPRHGAELKTLADVVSFMVPLLSMRTKRLLELNRPPDHGTDRLFVDGNIMFKNPVKARLPACAELSVRFDGSKNHRFSVENLLVGNKPHLRQVENEIIRLRKGGTLVLETVQVPIQRQPTTEKAFEVQSTIDLHWAIEEKSIVVRRRLYVAMTMTACGFLVVGGVLAGFLVGERIPGVDPFNIATFSWVLSAFIMLISKSLSVREWPWSDFLRGQVPCRSVSELHTVTGIDEQDILKYLLANDAIMMLSTRGPFNAFFTRRSEDGFSIDVKMNYRTVISSGIVVVKVATRDGDDALVCLDLRRGVEGRTKICHFDGFRDGKHILGCFDFPEAIHGSSDVQIQSLSRLTTCTRVRGIFNGLVFEQGGSRVAYRKFR